jgi:hypothetical protein
VRHGEDLDFVWLLAIDDTVGKAASESTPYISGDYRRRLGVVADRLDAVLHLAHERTCQIPVDPAVVLGGVGQFTIRGWVEYRDQTHLSLA